MRRKTTRIAPYSRPPALGRLDGRTREGKFLKRTRAELTAHVGNNPSATQRALVERASFLMLRVALLDEKQAASGWTEHDTRTYLAWCAALTRLMRQLGLKSAERAADDIARAHCLEGTWGGGVNVLAALDDPATFAPHFRGDTWKPWRAFLGALFALTLDDAALATYRAHTGRQNPPAVPFKEAALVIGRRGGKSRVLGLIAVFLACFRDYDPFLAPGEVAMVAVIASDRRQARSIFRFTTGLLKAVGMLADMIEDETAETITLNNRVVIEIVTASFRVTRGYNYAAILCDEIAFWRSDDSANPDVEIIAALRPGMATIPGAVLLLASSPYRRRGVLWNTFTKHFGQDNARVLVWRGTSLEMNPSLDPAIVAEAYEDDPDAAAAEYGAEFRSDLSDFVPRAVVTAATVPGRFELPPITGLSYVAFADPSGGTGADSMTLAVAHREGERAILDAVREVRPPFSPETVTGDFASLLKTYRVHRVVGDRYAGSWPTERFRVHGIAYEPSEQPKSDLYRDFLPLLNGGRAELLDVPRLASQLCGLERRTARSGRDSIDHAPNAHDDLANVAAGALLLANAKNLAPATVQPLRL